MGAGCCVEMTCFPVRLCWLLCENDVFPGVEHKETPRLREAGGGRKTLNPKASGCWLCQHYGLRPSCFDYKDTKRATTTD